jgi:hypothetical protein
MTAQTLEVTGGDVIEVQLTSETVVIDTHDGRRLRAEPGHITNRMRLFVRHTDGAEKKYDFEETELGVRETQRVAIVRGRLKRDPDFMNLVLYNLSSGDRDTFDGNLRRYLGKKPFFGPLWKAAGFALVVAVVFYLVSHFVYDRGHVGAAFLGAMFAFLTYPVFWWLCRTWDRVTERMRMNAALKRFLAETDARARTFAPPAAASPASA